MMDSYISSAFNVAQSQSAKTPNLHPGGKTNEQIRATAEDFEAVFLTQMLEQMFSGLSTDGMFGGGQGEKIFRSMMAQEYGKVMAANGGIGIADEVAREMLKMQEAGS